MEHIKNQRIEEWAYLHQVEIVDNNLQTKSNRIFSCPEIEEIKYLRE